MTAYEYTMKWAEEYKMYSKTLKKYGVNIAQMAMMQEEIDNGKYRVVVTSERFHKTPSGNWQSKPYESETKEIDAKIYLNIITSIPMFDDKVTLGYTKYGRIPVGLSCISWGTGDTKAKRTFKFESL